MAAKLAASGDAATSTKLALIYSRLAELEIQSEKKSDAWEEITKKIGPEAIHPAEISNIEAIFREAAYGATKLVDGRQPPVDAEAASRVRLLFLAEQQFSESLKSSLSDKLSKLKAFKSERDGYASEMFRVREEMLTQDLKTRDLEELCRSLQKLCKEKDEHRALLVQQEREKTQHLERECVQSIEAVTKKIEEEEAELDQKAAENEELRIKLEQFSQHLALRREKLKNEERAKDLQARLAEARKAQVDFASMQQKLSADAYKSKLRHLEEAIATLRGQVAMYGGKFEEFEDTLTRSCSILQKVEERERALDGMLVKMVAENDALRASAAQADVGLIQAMGALKEMDDALLRTKQAGDKLERKCRRVLAKRQELSRRLPAAPSSSSSAGAHSQPATSTGMGSPESFALPPDDAPTRPHAPIPIALEQAPSTPVRRAKPGLPANAPTSSSVSHSPSRVAALEVGVDELAGGEESPVSSPAVRPRAL